MAKESRSEAAHELSDISDEPGKGYDAGYSNPENALLEVCLRQAMTPEAYQCLERGLPALNVVVAPGPDWLAPLNAYLSGVFRHKTIPKLVGIMDRPGKSPIAEAVRSFSAGRNVVLLTDDTELISPRLRSIANIFTISAPSAVSFRRLARMSFSGRIAPKTDLDLTPLTFTEMLAAMPVGGPVSTVVANLKLMLSSKTVENTIIDAPNLSDQPQSEAVVWGMQLIQDLDDYRAGRLDWRDVDRGCVLTGAPGTGKTMLIHSIAAGARIPVIKCSIVEMFAGSSYLHTTIANLKQAFADAMRVRPSILFFDELDSLPGREAPQSSRNRDYWSALNAAFLLFLDDGSPSREGVVVIGATNRPSMLDPALLRPGRFEKIIEMPLPDAFGRECALRHLLKGDLPDADLSTAVKLTAGMTPADLMDLIRSARRKARRLRRDLALGDLSKILELRTLSGDRRTRVAVHEAGHGLIAHSLTDLRLLDISLIINGGQLGSARFEAKTDGREGMEALVTAFLGGMAAEMEVLGNIGSGAGIGEKSDLAKATALLTGIHATLGLGESLVWRGDGRSATELINTDAELRAAVQSDLRRLLASARALVRNNLDAVRRLADALVEKLVLNSDDVAEIIGEAIEKPGLPS